MASQWRVNSSNILKATVTDSAGTAVTDATVTVTVKDKYGDEMNGETWPLTLSHVSNGLYQATASSDCESVKDGRYTAVYVATKSGDRVEEIIDLIGVVR